MATERLSVLEHPHAVDGTLERKAIDIIVPVYKSVQLTTRCLNSLADHIQEIAASNPRLIVINDSPGEPDVHEMLVAFAKRHSYVTVLENEVNLGFVRSVNKGLEIACKAGRDVILVNADTETFQDTLKNLVDAAYSDPQIGFASPRSNNASICSLPHFHGGTVADQVESYERWKVLSRTMPAFHFTPTAVGFYLYIKHVILANFGFLDPEFGLGYEEENDLILRANKVGYRAVLVNNAFAFHAGSASFSLLDMNLSAHQGANLQKMAKRHPEFLPLVHRYEDSAHYRAETLLSHLLPTASGLLKVLFDLSSVGPNFNGTNEMGMAIIDGLYRRHSSTFEFNVICSRESFEFHKLDRYDGLRRYDTEHPTAEKFAIGIQLGQPFSVHAISLLEDRAIINIFGMLDTIGDDCGYLSITHRLASLWGHIAQHANGMFFNSKFSEQCVIARYPDAKDLPRFARLLPTKLSSYKKQLGSASAGEHVLIMGNHFAHKGVRCEPLRHPKGGFSNDSIRRAGKREWRLAKCADLSCGNPGRRTDGVPVYARECRCASVPRRGIWAWVRSRGSGAEGGRRSRYSGDARNLGDLYECQGRLSLSERRRSRSCTQIGDERASERSERSRSRDVGPMGRWICQILLAARTTGRCF